MRFSPIGPAIGLLALGVVAAWGADSHEPPTLELDLSNPSSFNVLSEPFSLERGETLPDELLNELSTRSQGHESGLEMFTCTENVVKDGGSKRPLEYLLGVDAQRRFEIEELRFKGGERTDRRSEAVPPPAAWATLFSDLNRPYFVYRYLGVQVRGYEPVHAVLFRGSLWFNGGTDIREWEGVAYMDPVTLDPLYVEAVPRLHTERAKHQAQKRARALKLNLAIMGVPLATLSTRRRPVLTSVSVDFAATSSGRALPAEMTRRRYKFSDSDVTEKILDVRRYADYRFFDTRTRERIGEIR